MRLIDADKLIEQILKKHKEAEIYVESVEEVKDAYCDVVSIIDDLATAFDVDEVLGKISTYGTYDDYGNVIDVLEIAEQVMRGGKDDK